ncbi:MAG TPA: serine hydrolase, partial [Methylomirabilota bacterium]
MKFTGRLVLGALVAAVVGCAASSAPRFAADGPGAEEYGAREGYPVRFVYRVPFFVGAFSHYDEIYESRIVRRAVTPSRLARASAEPALRYEYEAETRTLDDYLARNPTTGLLIARGDTILVERYQYARNDR